VSRRRLGVIPLLLLAAFVTTGADSYSTTAIDTNPSATQPAEDTATEEDSGNTEAAPPPGPKAPRPIVLRGHGKVVKSIRLKTNTPVVVSANHSGQSNFIVDLVGHGAHEFLFNEIGRYKGQSAIEEELRPAKYRVAIDADGHWTLKFEQPVPKPNSKRLPGTLKGHGARVVPVRTDDDMQPVIRGTHKGESNFIVGLIAYGDLSGYFNLFNEIGRFRGEVLADEELPAGDYLVWVQAAGAWTLKFSP
jgi:hypothetical protein